MRYKTLSSDYYCKNRSRFINKLLPKGLAIFNSNDIYPISADSTLPFRQHSDILYLSGIDQEETILLLFPDAKKLELREILFVRESNNKLEIWEGKKFSKNQVTKLSGIKTVMWLNEFERVFSMLIKEAKIIYLNTNEHHRANSETQTREDRFINWFKNRFPNYKTEKSNFILQDLRSVKDREEICQIQNAIDISEKGYRRVLSFIRPNLWEYEVEAEFANEFIKNSSKGFAYNPIIASGKNNNVLHYIKNNAKLKSGELVLIDVGAEYGNYSSDITRTIPISGKFTNRQKDVYNAVLKVLIEAQKLMVPGVFLEQYDREIGKLMSSALIDLKLLDRQTVKSENPKKPAYKKYFMHGISHHLGLDTHDYGLIDAPFQKNMVFTIEPGIYLKKEGFGIRIEDDFLISDQIGAINLSERIPRDPDVIEDLMS